MPHNLSDTIRILNLCLGIVIVVWLVIRRVRNKELYKTQLRSDIWLMALYWTSASIVSAIENLLNTQTASRVVLATAALIVTLRILTRYDKDWYRSEERK